MKYLISIKDLRTETFTNPVGYNHIQEANRAYRGMVNDPKYEDMGPYKFPSEYAMCVLGEFNEQTGQLTSYDKPIQVCVLDELKISNPGKAVQHG